MGVDLCQYGNHKIDFDCKKIAEIAEKIKDKLNALKLINIDYLKVLMNLWDSSDLEIPKIMLINVKNGIYKNITEETWDWKYDIINEDDYQYIRLIGFRNFELEFTKDKIYFWDPPYRFVGWFFMGSIIRDEWRKYMFQIIKLFDGNRAIYLPDSILDSEIYLDDYDGIDSPFEEIEKDLIKEYGKNNFNFDTIKKEDNIYYYIDYFEDLNIENKITIKKFQDYLWEKNENEIKSR